MTSAQTPLTSDCPQPASDSDPAGSANALLEFSLEHCPETPLGVVPSAVVVAAKPHRSASQAAACQDGVEAQTPLATEGTLEELNARLTQTLYDAEEGSRLKSEFLTNMSHELRTPLNGILGVTELLFDTTLDSVQDEYLGMIRSSASDLLTIICDVLDFSRIEAGRFDLSPSLFEIREQLNLTVRTLAIRAQQKGLEFVYRLSPGVPDEVIGDARRLIQALSNLVGNAIKFTERGEISVEVAVEEQTDEKITLHFQVTDTGIGIAPESAATIFDAFRQADGSTTRRHGGTGLGLAITHQITEMMNGRVWVDSWLGKGSTFHFTAEFGRTGRPQLHPTRPEILDGLEVLVVDDSRMNREVLEEILCRHGMKPTLVADGAIALQVLEKSQKSGSPWPLVLVDDRMPRVHGFIIAETFLDRTDLAQSLVMMITPGDRRSGQQRIRELHEASQLIPQTVRERAVGDETRRRTSLRRCQDLKLPCVLKPCLEADLIQIIEEVASRNAADRDSSQECAPAQRTPRNTAARRVLLAEDNRINQTIAVHLLHKNGFEVSVARNGRQALDLLEHEFFDVVLMDIQMPELDGYGATEQIRASSDQTIRQLPIIALTAHNNDGDRERCLAASMDGYVTKPIQPDQLFAEIDRILGSADTTEADTTEADTTEADTTEADTTKEKETVDPFDATMRTDQDEDDSSPVLDREELMRRVEGNVALLRALVGTFETTHLEYLMRIRDAVDGGDFESLETSAHGLKGAVATLGGGRASAVALELEQLGRDRRPASEATGTVDVLAKELELLRQALRELVEEGADQ